MNYQAIGYYLSIVLKVESVFLLVPMTIALLFQDFHDVLGFVVTIALTLGVSLLLGLCRPVNRKIYAKEGFITVALSWIAISLFGALPFYISGEVPSFIDCLFESVSGFTTTGASIIVNVDNLTRGLLFWRSFTHWVGGMGVLVFIMAVIPKFAGERALYMMKAEAPGPSPGKLVPKLRQSSKILYIIYFGLTLAEILLLAAGGMPLFDSVLNTMSTVGTGGFSTAASSIQVYDSAYLEGVITVFMVLSGVNFNLYFLLILRNLSGVYRNTELRAYLGILAVSIGVVSLNLYRTVYDSFGQSLRYASFQVSSIMTSTGFTSTNFEAWPQLSKTLLWVLMFVGACSGSTGGGIKVSRLLILFKECRRNLSQMIRPRAVESVKLDGKTLDATVIHGVSVYFMLYFAIFLLSVVAVSIDQFDFESAVGAVSSCLNNIGQGFGQAGPSGSYAAFSPLTKLVLSLDMLLGRLEIYPILLLLSPRTWRRV